jgi:large subunit ribosomal protein L29
MKKRDELKELSRGELEEKNSQYRSELFNLRFQKATGQLDNTGRIREAKRMVARIMTALKQKDLQDQSKE